MIVTCGEALVDMVPHAVPGGGPMNVAIAAARLGVPSAFLGRVSTDDFGSLIWDHIAANGVDLRAAERGSEPTARAIVEDTPRLAFRFEGEGTADTMLGSADLSPLGDGPHIVHGGTLGMFRGATAETLAQLVERHTGIVSLDPNVRPQIIDDRAAWDGFHERWCAHAHVYRASDEDLEWIFGARSTDSIAAELLGGAAEVVMVTKGPDGAMVYTADGSRSVPGVVVDVVDTVGAGDTFVGSVLASLWQGGHAGDPATLRQISLEYWSVIVARAIAAAAITCSRLGADPPTASELADETRF